MGVQHPSTESTRKRPIGRPRAPGTEAERAAARRAKVRLNVQAFRQRQKEKKLLTSHAQFTGRLPYYSSSNSPEPTGTSISWSHCSRASSAPRVFSLDEAGTAIDPALRASIPLPNGLFTPHLNLADGLFLDDTSSSSSIDLDAEYTSTQGVANACSGWLPQDAGDFGKTSTQSLVDALVSSALTIIGRQRNDHELALHGVYIQARALRRLNQAFEGFMSGDNEVSASSLSTTALTCAMSELLAHKSWSNFARHLQGVGALIQCSGSLALVTPEAREQFFAYRGMQAAFCFSQCRNSFLTKPEWRNFRWKAECDIASHPMHSMLDIGLEIVPELARDDILEPRDMIELRYTLRKLRDLTEQLNQWQNDLELRHVRPLYRRVPTKWYGFQDTSLEFLNVTVASAFTFYTGVRIKLAALTTKLTDQLAVLDHAYDESRRYTRIEMLRWARLSCQCYEYFYSRRPKVSGRIICLFPFDAAWETFVQMENEGSMDLAPQLEWCQAMAERFASQGLAVFEWRGTSSAPSSRPSSP